MSRFLLFFLFLKNTIYLNIVSDHGTEEAPLLVPTWSQTKTLQGLEADDLAKDVRAKRGTVMQTVRYNLNFYSKKDFL